MRRALPTLLALLLLAPAVALAAPEPAVTDCTSHNALTRHYSVAELRRALATMPADVKEYTACPDVIQQALDNELGGVHARGGNGSGGGSFLPGPVIAVVLVLVLGGAVAAALALRRRGSGAA